MCLCILGNEYSNNNLNVGVCVSISVCVCGFICMYIWKYKEISPTNIHLHVLMSTHQFNVKNFRSFMISHSSVVFFNCKSQQALPATPPTITKMCCNSSCVTASTKSVRLFFHIIYKIEYCVHKLEKNENEKWKVLKFEQKKKSEKKWKRNLKEKWRKIRIIKEISFMKKNMMMKKKKKMNLSHQLS